VTIQGQRHYLWRAVDEDGDVIDILVQSRRDRAATRFFRKLLKGQGQPSRQGERQMRRLKSAAHVQRFTFVHGLVQNLFRVGRHLLRSAHHRLLRRRAFLEWQAVTCAY
jgi:putative transposase